ncbi:helicase HerA-like domain-containing protein [Lacisediminihabitans sp. H27-G8]|uniref:helicase HerA-like domain-containing protein n=1 Tax=Lacisediminihabitans sp. H27-G8 TaxID=3111909 RepID=UPI0038FC41D8
MTDAAALVEAAKKALADAEAALAAERASAPVAAAQPPAAAAQPPAAAAQPPVSTPPEASPATPAQPAAAPANPPEAAAAPAQPAAATANPPEAAAAPASPPTASHSPAGPLDAAAVEVIRSGYAFSGTVLEIGALVNGDAQPRVQVRIPIAMLNRHGLVAGATGTGKTRTLQVLAEQLAAAGVPVFAADIKGDLSGVATAGAENPKLIDRTNGIGQHWTGASFPTEYFALGGVGKGVPVRATVSGFGPLLLSKVLGLNGTQESSLGLVFHYAAQAGLPLVDLSDLRAVLSYLTSADGKGELTGLGGLSSATVGVILRELITFADQGADVFFGEPEIDTADFLRTHPDGRGIISLLEVPGVQDKPELYSTFLMWLLADLFNDLPEVGDLDKPKLVFFFDEAHLLFKNASKDFLDSITQTVRLIRSKGVGIVFVTQTPKDVPGDVLAQLGSRIQHQLRAFTPDDAKALKATVSTYPNSDYDLGSVLTTLATGEAIVTVMGEKGAPTPVAWTRLRAPQGAMSPSAPELIEATIASSILLPKYGTAIDNESATEMLGRKLAAAAATAAAANTAAEQAAAAKQQQADYERMLRDAQKSQPRASSTTSRRAPAPRAEKNPITDFLGSSAGKSIVNSVVKGIFGTLRRR